MVDKLSGTHAVCHRHCVDKAYRFFDCTTRRSWVDLSSAVLIRAVCVCMCVWGPGPGWCIRDRAEWSETCARGRGQGSSYTNTPGEIECKRASRPLGPPSPVTTYSTYNLFVFFSSSCLIPFFCSSLFTHNNNKINKPLQKKYNFSVACIMSTKSDIYISSRQEQETKMKMSGFIKEGKTV